MNRRVTGWAVVAAAGIGAMLFAPVFGAAALVVAVVVPLVLVLLVDEVTSRWAVIAPLRPLIGLLVGLFALLEILFDHGVPTIDALRDFASAGSDGWVATLESTWPARPEPRFLLFVPLLALMAGVVGLEVVRRGRSPLVALLPSLVVVVLSQAFQSSGGVAAVLWAFGYALVAVLAIGSAELVGSAGFRPRVIAPVIAVAVGALLVFLVVPAPRNSYSLKDGHVPVTAPSVVANPLDEIGARLAQPDTVVFRVRTDAAVDRWTVALFDRFDGVSWNGDGGYLTFGGALGPDPAVTAPTVSGNATITVAAPAGPWLPTAGRTRSVSGVDAVVDPVTGTMLSTAPGAATYNLTWDALPESDGDRAGWTLGGAPVATALPDPPAALADVAKNAVDGAPPSFGTALALESWFRENYKLAEGENVPTGRAYPQLLHFLGTTKRGTSEQFAAAYVVLARAAGIPARLAVGYRQPDSVDEHGEHVVRNADVFAWPEVPVMGRGWIALDPSGAVAKTDAEGQSQVAPPQPPPSTTTAPPPTSSAAESGNGEGTTSVETPPSGSSGWPLGIATVVLVLPVIASVPLAKLFRRKLRRGRPPVAAIVGASLEARDLLRDHGVPVRRGMTVRDLANQASSVLGDRLDADLLVLRGCVDLALWSGDPVSRDTADRAWSAVDGARRNVVTRPRWQRIRAALALRGLLPPRRQEG